MLRKLPIIAVITFWSLMTGLLLKKEYFARTSDDYTGARPMPDPECLMGVYYSGERIGEFRLNSYPWTDYSRRGYCLVSSLHLKYPPIGEAHINGKSFTDEKLFLRKFEYYLKCKLKMFDEQEARLEGSLRKDKLFLKVRWGTFEKSFHIPAEGGISLYDPITPWIAGEKFYPGREYSVEVLNRFTRERHLAKVRVLRKKSILFDEEAIPGFEVETIVEGLRSIFWIGRDGKVYKMESPLGFSLLREPLTTTER